MEGLEGLVHVSGLDLGDPLRGEDAHVAVSGGNSALPFNLGHALTQARRPLAS